MNTEELKLKSTVEDSNSQEDSFDQKQHLQNSDNESVTSNMITLIQTQNEAIPSLKKLSDISTKDHDLVNQGNEEVVLSTGHDLNSKELSDIMLQNNLNSELLHNTNGPSSYLEINEPSSSTREDTNSKDKSLIYNVKWIKFNLRNVPIIMQNENGPCPLIAIANVLFLRGNLKLNDDIKYLVSDKLNNMLSDLLFREITEANTNSPNYEKQLSDVLSQFPYLHTGLNINIKFSSVESFEYTSALELFDLFKIDLFHGWLPDPEHTPELTTLLFEKSYNQLVEFVIQYKDQEITSVDKSHQAMIINEFLESTKSQLTFHGLLMLSKTLKEDQISVLFRNNHFSTILKHNGQIFVLVTDFGFLKVQNVIWEALMDIDGDTQYVDSSFRLYQPLESFSDQPQDLDQELALELHQKLNSPSFKDDEKLAKQLYQIELHNMRNDLNSSVDSESSNPVNNNSNNNNNRINLGVYPQDFPPSRRNSQNKTNILWSSLKRSFSDFLSPSELLKKLQNGDRSTLARAITLIESKRTDHKIKSRELISNALNLMINIKPSSMSFRIGFSGPPGAGKSTFIEALGTNLLSQKLPSFERYPVTKLSILTVDPSSLTTGGSLLADKTRMNELATDVRAFIRPSPSGGNLGGVARTTSETIILCETAGFPLVLVETVGVGQSEYSVAEMVDCFVLIIPPAGGDELQGLKRGIVEFADIVVVNKADGELKSAARRIASEYSSALKYMKKRHQNWIPKVMLVSSVTHEGISEFWENVLDFRNNLNSSGEMKIIRNYQRKAWMWNYIKEGVLEIFKENPEVSKQLESIENEVEKGKISPGAAADFLLQIYKR